MEPTRSRESFDAVAADYERYRPAPPDAVVDALAAAAGIGPGTRVLEIGCGAGQVSVPLVTRGARLTAVELGADLAARARRRLAPFPDARVVVGAFEVWPPPDEPFDALVCASAFHWIDPDVRWSRCAALLRPGGALAILHVHHVQGGTPGFVDATQPVYVGWGLSDAAAGPRSAADTPWAYPDLDGRAEFVEVARLRFDVEVRSSTEEYVGWLRTDSLVNAVDDVSRTGFLADIGGLIDRDFGGTVTRAFVHELVVARTPGDARISAEGSG